MYEVSAILLLSVLCSCKTDARSWIDSPSSRLMALSSRSLLQMVGSLRKSRNSSRPVSYTHLRKENGLFFSSLVISIVAFYMILSISTQDVMLFLQKMESDAVDKLLRCV